MKLMKQMQNPCYILPAVAVVLFNEKGEVLLQKRRDTNKWCIISGHVEFGETVENAALREIREETDKEASIVRLIGVYSSPNSQTYSYQDRSVQYITTYFQAVLKEDIIPGFSNEETIELKFFKTDQLPDDMALINENWLNDALSISGQPYIR